MLDHFSLLDLNKLVKATLDKTLAPSYWVVAEIAELRVNQNGHCYLELVEKEENRILAKSRATIWSYTYRNLSLWFEKMTGETLKSGLKILCNVQVQYHEIYGLSFNIKDIDANFTLGERERKRQEVLNRLESDGVVDMNKAQHLGRVISNMAIISSPAAAGYEDFMNQLVNNSYGYEFKVRLFKATMQGDGAPESIVNALHTIHNSSELFDAIVIIRGGGSKLDLDCFDDYELNFNACQIPVPIITGIGHERDESILDLIAFKSLKTPTAVAEWVINKSLDYESELLSKLKELLRTSSFILKQKENHLNSLKNKILNGTYNNLIKNRHRLDQLTSQVIGGTQNYLTSQRQQLTLMGSKIEYLDPNSVLKRGYTMTTKNGRSITTENVKEGDIIETRTLSSILKSEIKDILATDEEN